MIKVLIVDDEKAICDLIDLNLSSAGYHCSTVQDGLEAIDKIEKDFVKTLAKCHKVTLVEAKERSLLTKLSGHVLRMVAPLM